MRFQTTSTDSNCHLFPTSSYF